MLPKDARLKIKEGSLKWPEKERKASSSELWVVIISEQDAVQSGIKYQLAFWRYVATWSFVEMEQDYVDEREMEDKERGRRLEKTDECWSCWAVLMTCNLIAYIICNFHGRDMWTLLNDTIIACPDMLPSFTSFPQHLPIDWLLGDQYFLSNLNFDILGKRIN